MSEMTNKVTTKHEIRGEVQITKVYPELENLTVTPTKAIQSFNHPDSYGYNNVMVKAIDCETLNVTPRKELQTFDGMYDKVNVRAIDCETLNITPKQESQAFDGMYDKVNVNAIVGDTLNVKPTATAQTFNGLYETVNVEKVQGSNLRVTPKEAEQSFNGLYETVNVGAIETEEVTIDPDFSSQDTVEVVATEGKYIKKATVNKDTNLVPENILEGEVVCGIEGTGRNGIDTSDATATAEDIAKDKTAYVNGEKIVGTMEQTTGEYNALVDMTITKGAYNMPALVKIIKKLPDNIVISGTSAEYTFAFATNLETAPKLDTSKLISMQSMFNGCEALVTVPYYDMSNVTNTSYMFSGCTSLSDESLNTIMAMCINAPNVLYKTLANMNLTVAQRVKCKSLSNYQAFLDAGWTLG